MGNRGNSIEDQMNLFKIVYKLKVSELRKKCKRLKKSEHFWLSKHDEMKEKMKGLVDQIDKPKTVINSLLIFKSEANLRNNLITNKLTKEKTLNKTLNNFEAKHFNFNENCTKLMAEYDEEHLKAEIVALNDELEMLYYEQEEPNQQLKVFQKVLQNIQPQKTEHNSQLDDVINSVKFALKPKKELQCKLQYYKKMKFLN